MQLCSVYRLDEEVRAATDLALWQRPTVEERACARRALLLDFNAHVRKYEALLAAQSDARSGSGSGSQSRRKKREEASASELASRNVRVEEAEAALEASTRWLTEQFDADGSLLEGPISALVACQLHLARSTTRQLESVAPRLAGVVCFACLRPMLPSASESGSQGGSRSSSQGCRRLLMTCRD